MQTLLDQQLYDYLSIILAEACAEKNENINHINNLIAKQSINIGKQKHCHECGKNEIENSKRKCTQCNAKLLTLTKTQQETEQITPEKEDSTKSFIFRSHKFETDISDKHTNSISIT